MATASLHGADTRPITITKASRGAGGACEAFGCGVRVALGAGVTAVASTVHRPAAKAAVDAFDLGSLTAARAIAYVGVRARFFIVTRSLLVRVALCTSACSVASSNDATRVAR